MNLLVMPLAFSFLLFLLKKIKEKRQPLAFRGNYVLVPLVVSFQAFCYAGYQGDPHFIKVCVCVGRISLVKLYKYYSLLSTHIRRAQKLFYFYFFVKVNNLYSIYYNLKKHFFFIFQTNKNDKLQKQLVIFFLNLKEKNSKF